MEMKPSFAFCPALTSALGLTSTMLAVPNPLVQAAKEQDEPSPRLTDFFFREGPLMTAHWNAVRSLTNSGPRLALDLSTAWDDFEIANARKAMLFGYQRTLNNQR
jgi:hypothetical protein